MAGKILITGANGGFPPSFTANLLKPGDKSREADYGEFAEVPVAVFQQFEGFLKMNPQQDPQQVAIPFADLIDMPKDEKPFRTTVDYIGMSDPIEKYNEHLEQIMKGEYSNFGTQQMLNVRK